MTMYNHVFAKMVIEDCRLFTNGCTLPDPHEVYILFYNSNNNVRSILLFSLFCSPQARKKSCFFTLVVYFTFKKCTVLPPQTQQVSLKSLKLSPQIPKI